MRAKARDMGVAGVDHASKRMRQRKQRFPGPLAINPGQPHAGAGLCKRVRRKTGLVCRGDARRADRLHRLLRADACRGRPGRTPAQHTAFRILDAGPATGSAAIDTDIEPGLIR